ncbi:MAG TPA: SAM-dependent methyltransferase [Chitinophagaceae bacterium]|nr:SAM-dependent methyltransferase [Chitinophagaceae bacterium]
MGTVYLIPSPIDDAGLEAIPAAAGAALRDCQVIFAENERAARRYLRRLDRSLIIDSFEWFTLHQQEKEMLQVFRDRVKAGKNVAILSEAGCPGVADPGQLLVAAAQEMRVKIRPVTGPSSLLLALMASGMNGQRFQFHGYLPVESQARDRAIRELESESRKKDCTQLFIETPYRNQKLFDAVLRNCQPATRLCIAAGLTGDSEWIRTQRISEWKKEIPLLGKRATVFLMHAK